MGNKGWVKNESKVKSTKVHNQKLFNTLDRIKYILNIFYVLSLFVSIFLQLVITLLNPPVTQSDENTS